MNCQNLKMVFPHGSGPSLCLVDISQVFWSCGEADGFCRSFQARRSPHQLEWRFRGACRYFCEDFRRFWPICACARHSYRAAFVLISLWSRSCRPRRWLDVADGVEDLSEDVARHGSLCQLERDLAGMAHNPCPDLDQAALDAGERPVGNLFG